MNPNRTRAVVILGAATLITATSVLALQEASRAEQMRERSAEIEARIEAEPFVGVTTDGTVVPGLFEIRSTGVSTAPVRAAADVFLTALGSEQRDRATFAVDDSEWRKWMNQHFYVRQGVGFDEIDVVQREAAFALLRTSLSARGLQLSRDIMRLNHTLGELNGDNFDEYGEWLYWITVMGEPSATEPWGWQLDGHHLIVNYFVLGDQVVMTPTFVGSEPAVATSGKYAGTAILQQEQSAGLAMLQSLGADQRARTVLSADKDGNNNQGEALRDNLVIDYAGAPVADFTEAQQQRLLELIRLYVGNLRPEHAEVWMQDVADHLPETWFAWVGGDTEESAYYYRIHSPVILIEFDHQRPANLRHINTPGVPNRDHIHAVIRTPNGNDYGKDLLRQHYATADHHH